MSNEVNVPEGVQVFRYEGGDLVYEPRDSALGGWDGNLNDLIGDYISVESIDLIRNQERQRQRQALLGDVAVEAAVLIRINALAVAGHEASDQFRREYAFTVREHIEAALDTLEDS